MMGDYRIVSSSSEDKVRKIYREREDARRVMRDSFYRGLESWRYYFAKQGDQWPEKELAMLREEDRVPYQYNILTPKIKTMAGAIIMDLPDIDWIPLEGERTTGTEAIKDSYFADKEITNWEFALIQLVIAGLVHNGWVEMVETKKYHPLGNIGLEYIREGSLIPDPYWKTRNDRDLKCAWKNTYFTAAGLAFKYQKTSDKIREAILRKKLHGKDTPPDRMRYMYDEREVFKGKVGDEYEVIEYMWIEILKKERLVGRRTGETEFIAFPCTEDQAYLQKFGETNNIDWTTVNPEPYDDIISHKTAVAPGLDPTLILHDAKTRVQVKGLPIFHFTTDRYKGEDKGLAETIMDTQTNLNKRINRVTDLISKAGGGSRIMNEMLFTNPTQKEEWRKNSNKAGWNHWADLDSVKTPMVEVGASQYPGTIFSQIELLFDQLLPVVSGVSDAWSAQSASQESGILFERKVQMNKIGTLIMDKQVKQLLNNIGEAYMYQWPITYGDMPREISTKGGKGKIVLNERLPDGSIRNGVDYTPRTRAIVTESLKTPTRQMQDRAIAIEMLRSINPQTNPLSYQNYMEMMLNSMSHREEDMEQYKLDSEIEKATARTALIAQIAQNEAATSAAAVQETQAQAMLAQAGIGQPQGEQPMPQVTQPKEQVQAPTEEPTPREETGMAEGMEQLI